ncbi:MAG: phosphonate C-P lyase system protein PhnH [Pseudomonadota bacterium]
MNTPASEANIYLDGGFSNPVYESQDCFRTIMNAMARPGRIFAFEPKLVPPRPLSSRSATVLCTLCDADTTVHIDQSLAGANAVISWLVFQTGTEITTHEKQADFAFVPDPRNMPGLELFSTGTDEYPETSTTLIIEMESLEGGTALLLEGPGIKDVQRFAPKGLPDHFMASWMSNRTLFPRGVDIIFVAPEGLSCLPRSTNVMDPEK